MCESEIVLHPSDLLRKKAIEVRDFSDPKLLALIKNLFETLDSFDHCVGLAANQIGGDLNVFVADASKNKSCESSFGRIAIINPVIVLKRELAKSREGCMSVPDFTGDVNRATDIVLRGFSLSGENLELAAKGFEAKIFQHEVDHLNGKLFIDRVASSRDIFARKRYRT